MEVGEFYLGKSNKGDLSEVLKILEVSEDRFVGEAIHIIIKRNDRSIGDGWGLSFDHINHRVGGFNLTKITKEENPEYWL